VPGESNVFLVVEHETGKKWRLEKTGGAPSGRDQKRATGR